MRCFLNKKDLKKYKDLLITQKEKIIGNLQNLEGNNLNKSQKESSGDLSGYSTHMADAASDSYDREFALNIASKEGSILYDIDYALKRIEDKTYGVCESCEKEINTARLTAVPYAKFCIKCQDKEEKKGTRKKSPEGEATTRWDEILFEQEES